jgi:hypothetical protein
MSERYDEIITLGGTAGATAAFARLGRFLLIIATTFPRSMFTRNMALEEFMKTRADLLGGFTPSP